MKNKVPKEKTTPDFLKKPRMDSSLSGSISETPVWMAGAVDLDGRWGWKKIGYSLFFDCILPKIQDFEKMRWSEILGKNSHEINVGQIIKPAQDRLRDLKMDDCDTLVSIRLTGKQRIWGIKIGKTFKILWWDPEHEIYPSKLKHT